MMNAENNQLIPAVTLLPIGKEPNQPHQEQEEDTLGNNNEELAESGSQSNVNEDSGQKNEHGVSLNQTQPEIADVGDLGKYEKALADYQKRKRDAEEALKKLQRIQSEIKKAQRNKILKERKKYERQAGVIVGKLFYPSVKIEELEMLLLKLKDLA